MNCPRCQVAVLEERDRDGLVIDLCPECRGIWLDRGELERLIARAKAEFEEEERWRTRLGGQAPEPPRELPPLPRTDSDRGHSLDRERYRRDDDDDDDDDDDRHRRHPKKRRWFDAISEILD